MYMDFWIKDWTTFIGNGSDVGNATSSSSEVMIVPGWSTVDQFLLLYGVIGASAAIASGIRSIVWVMVSLRAARTL